jgi:hypothetical protein
LNALSSHNSKQTDTVAKKAHTCKGLIVTDMSRRILWISPLAGGSVHDFSIFKSVFSGLDFSKLAVWVDLGFLGIDKQVTVGELFIPFKASKHEPLDETAKEYNSIISSMRVRIEHAFAHLKSFFILRIKNRMRTASKLDQVFNLCASLVNFRHKQLIVN